VLVYFLSSDAKIAPIDKLVIGEMAIKPAKLLRTFKAATHAQRRLFKSDGGWIAGQPLRLKNRKYGMRKLTHKNSLDR
jgi:hypothetical protein